MQVIINKKIKVFNLKMVFCGSNIKKKKKIIIKTLKRNSKFSLLKVDLNTQIIFNLINFYKRFNGNKSNRIKVIFNITFDSKNENFPSKLRKNIGCLTA